MYKSMMDNLEAVAEKHLEGEDKEEALAAVKKGREEHERNGKKLVRRMYSAPLLDLLAVVALIVSAGAVIYLFTQSLFQGFVSLVLAFFLVRYIFRLRSNDWLSIFRGRFY